MKKIIAMLLAVSLVLCFAACATTENPQPQNKGPVQDSFSITYNGTKIALHAPAAEVIAALGEPKSYSESTSCAFDGLDKTYEYDSFYLQTYPLDGTDYVYSFWFKDDLIANDEGLSIGATLADVQACYSGEYYNGTNAYQIKKGSGMLTILLEDDAVTSIQYVITTD